MEIKQSKSALNILYSENIYTGLNYNSYSIQSSEHSSAAGVACRLLDLKNRN